MQGLLVYINSRPATSSFSSPTPQSHDRAPPASEKELRRSEERYRLLFDADPNPVFVITPVSQVILDANDRAAEKYGYPKEKLVGMRFVELGYPDEAHADFSAFSSLNSEAALCSQLPRVRLKSSGDRCFGEHLFLPIHLYGKREHQRHHFGHFRAH